MAVNRAGKSAVVLSSVPLQLLLYLSALYYVFYFLSTFCMIIYKSRVLSYPDDLLTQDVGLLFIMAGLELLRLYCGVRGNLQETEGYIWVNLAMTAATALLSVYFLVWQLYVMHADVIINSILLSVYGLGGVFGLVTLARFTRLHSSKRYCIPRSNALTSGPALTLSSKDRIDVSTPENAVLSPFVIAALTALLHYQTLMEGNTGEHDNKTMVLAYGRSSKRNCPYLQ